jgi:hypothetical protein
MAFFPRIRAHLNAATRQAQAEVETSSEGSSSARGGHPSFGGHAIDGIGEQLQ